MGTKIQFQLSPEIIAAEAARREALRAAREAAKTPEVIAAEAREWDARMQREAARNAAKAEQAARRAAYEQAQAEAAERNAAGLATARQIDYLHNLGVTSEMVDFSTLTKKDASFLIDNVKAQNSNGFRTGEMSIWAI